MSGDEIFLGDYAPSHVSNLSSSAEPGISTDPTQACVRVQHAVVTYGRRRDVVDPDSSISSTEANLSMLSRHNQFSGSSQGVDEDAPAPTSECDVSRGTLESSEDEDEDKENILSSFQWDWKKKIQNIDEAFDTDTAEFPVLGHRASVETKDTTVRVASQTGQEGKPQSLPVTRSDMNVDGSSEEQLGARSHSPYRTLCPTSRSASNSPSASPKFQHAKIRTTVYHSDSDLDASSPRSLKTIHPITTPKTRSSLTPPTSEDETMLESMEKITRSGTSSRICEDKDGSNCEDAQSKRTLVKGKGKAKEQTRKIKPPTKKQIEESRRESARIISDQQVSILRLQDKRFTVTNLFEKLNARPAKLSRATPVHVQSSSDPIQPFSSSPAIRPESPSLSNVLVSGVSINSTRTIPSASSRSFKGLETLRSLSESDEEMPDAADLLREEGQRRAKQKADTQRLARLQETKKRVLEAQTARRESPHAFRHDDESDDDLEVVEADMQVVVDEETEQRRSHRFKPSTARSKHLAMAHLSTSVRQKEVNVARMELVGVSAFHSRHQESGGVTKRQLENILRKNAGKQANELTKQKEEEWIRRGGTLRCEVTQKAIADNWDIWVKKGLHQGKQLEQEIEFDADGTEIEGSDEEWTPLDRGSASPASHEGGIGGIHEDGAETTEISGSAVQQESTNSRDDDGDETTDKENHQPRRLRRAMHRLPAVVDSDEDDAGISGSRFLGRILVPDTSFVEGGHQDPSLLHRGSLSSLEDATEDENDKENDQRRMFDRGEDKENSSVTRHAVLGEGQSGLFDLEDGVRRRLSMSPSIAEEMHGFSADENAPETKRQPLEDLLRKEDAEDNPFFCSLAKIDSLQPGVSLRTCRSELLQYRTDGVGIPHATQDSGINSVPQVIAFPGGFSQLFETGTAPQRSPAQVNRNEQTGLDHLRKSDDAEAFSLTLDVGLQPALEVSDDLRRKANGIFEREQEYVVEEARQKMQKKAPELYVNDHGFLTQTRPNISSPQIYRRPLSQISPAFESQMADNQLFSQAAPRRPLRTLSFGSVTETPESGPRRRLKRRASPDGGYRSSLSPSPTLPQNALHVPRQVAHKKKSKALEAKMKLQKSEFIAGEAEESDDDNLLGFGNFKKQDDDEIEDEEQDKPVEGLVDDTLMDDETKAVDLVLEKVKEHQAEDDAALEKLHQAAAQGHLRTRRRDRGLAFEDSESDEDETSQHLRRSISKKRRIDGDNLEDLGKHEETRAFYEAYQRNLDEDVGDFVHLDHEDSAMSGLEEDEEGESAPREIVSTTEVLNDLRQAARVKTIHQPLDLKNTAWVDGNNSDEDDVGVKEVNLAPKKQPAPRQALRKVDFDGNLERPKRANEFNERERMQLTSWAREENLSRNVSTGRSGGAVTGLTRPKAANGASRMTQKLSVNGQHRRPTKTQSILSTVSEKQSGFDR